MCLCSNSGLVSQQHGEAVRVVQFFGDQKLVGLVEMVRGMLEVLEDDLDCLHHVLGGECLLVAACNSNEQTLDERKFGCQQRVFPFWLLGGGGVEELLPIGKLLSEDRIDQIVFQDVRVLLKEGRKVMVVRLRVAGSQRF